MKYQNIKYNILEKNINYKNIYYNKRLDSYKKILNLYNIRINPFLFERYNRQNSLKKKLPNISNNKLNIINKLLEGRHLNIDKNSNVYGILGLLKYSDYSHLVILSLLDNKTDSYTIYKDYITNTTTYNISLITCPIILNDINNINNYIYYIYKFIYYKNNNSYRSSIISLFYYFIGMFLSLFSLYFYNSIKIVYSNLIIISMKLSNFVILDNFNILHTINNNIYNIKTLNLINNCIYLSYRTYITYTPYLIGLTTYTLLNTGILSKLSFQNTLKTLQSIILNEKTEWSVDTKSNLIISDFISVGSGWYRYFIN